MPEEFIDNQRQPNPKLIYKFQEACAVDARNIGLRNIEVADTKICSIDGENGKLIYRGFDILIDNQQKENPPLFLVVLCRYLL
jgi:citrate synthase